MGHRYVSDRARAIHRNFRSVFLYIRKKWLTMDRNTRDVLVESLLEKIQVINILLRHEAVRGHLDPSLNSPVVSEQSSITHLLLRLQKQVKASAVLADVVSIGPGANQNEEEALWKIEEDLNLLYEWVSAASTQGSSTDSD
ncbi:unnamed protein product [Auanema sp. JU1783]|nr:unnamed protein product [Auanema sp. JU1783]